MLPELQQARGLAVVDWWLAVVDWRLAVVHWRLAVVHWGLAVVYGGLAVVCERRLPYVRLYILSRLDL